MNKRVLSLKKITNGREMTGRLRGARIREMIEKILKERSGPLRIILDFSGLGSIDFSWADEVVAKIVSRSWNDEYGEAFLVLKGLSPCQVENIHVALERKRLAALTVGPEGWRVIGSLNNYLALTLNQVMKKKYLTLKELSEDEKIGMNTSGTRLLNLYKKRLVLRVEGPTAGRQYIYQSLLA